MMKGIHHWKVKYALKEQTKGQVMNRINIMGIDVAKNVFSICGLDESGKVVVQSTVSRKKLLEKVMLLSPKVVAMEACGSSNYWARVFVKHGMETKLISAKLVKPFVKSQKNDAHDACAIAEACSRPNMRFVGIGTIAHQDIQSIHRIRGRLIGNRTSLINEIRGLLSEYGIIITVGVTSVRKNLPRILEDADNELTIRSRDTFAEMYQELQELDQRSPDSKKLFFHCSISETLNPCSRAASTIVF